MRISRRPGATRAVEIVFGAARRPPTAYRLVAVSAPSASFSADKPCFLMSPDHPPSSLCDLIERVAAARGAGQLNEALARLADAAFPLLAPAIQTRMRHMRTGGPDRMIEEAEDVLNQLLYRVACKASRFRGATNAEAESWLRRIAQRLVEDAAKTPRRRLALLLERLRRYGYQVNLDSTHPEWESPDAPPAE